MLKNTHFHCIWYKILEILYVRRNMYIKLLKVIRKWKVFFLQMDTLQRNFHS